MVEELKVWSDWKKQSYTKGSQIKKCFIFEVYLIH